MQRSSWYSIPLIVAVVFFVASALPTVAGIAGITPAKVQVSMLPNSRIEESFRISRSNPAQDELYTVAVRDDTTLIDIIGETEIVLPAGERLSEYTFEIDTTDLGVGEYEAIIDFRPKQTEDLTGGLTVQYGLAATIEVAVVETLPEAVTAIDASESIDAVGVVTIADLQVQQQEYTQGEKAVIDITFANESDVAVFNTPYTVTIYKDGAAFHTKKIQLSEVLSPGESEVVTIEQELIEFGAYEVHVDTTSENRTIPFSVEASSIFLAYSYWIVAGGLLVIVVALLVLYRASMQSNTILEPRKSLRVVGIISLIGIVVLSVAGVLVWYWTLPQLQEVEQLSQQRSGFLAIQSSDQEVGTTTTLVRLRDGVQQELFGDYHMFATANDRFYAVPALADFDEESSDRFFLFTDEYVVPYSFSELPGPILSISENTLRTYMLIEGTDIVSQQAYHCVTEVVGADGPHCQYVNNIVPLGEQVVDAAWSTELERYLVVTTDKTTYSYDPWTESVEQVMQDTVTAATTAEDAVKEGLQLARPFGTDTEDRVTPVSQVATFTRFFERYRVSAETLFYPLTGTDYLMEQGSVDARELSLVDVVSGEFMSLLTIGADDNVYLIQAGSRIAP